MLRAVLFDMGGPLDTEVTLERRRDEAIRRGLTSAGIPVSDAAYAEAAAWAVQSFAPNPYAAIIWRLLPNRDRALAARIYADMRASDPSDVVELREGIPELLSELRLRGLRLGVVANQAASSIHRLEQARIAQQFDHLGISALAGYDKPDPRLFLLVCDALQVEPSECIMVGDRIDNDVVPARLLGMRTVLLRSGRHIAQQPRSWHELPDFEVANIAEMRKAILALLTT